MANQILLVEDDIFILELYQRELVKSGFEVQTCSDGNTALKLVEEKDYDLVMLDIMIPEKDGIAVLTSIKQNPKKKDTKVLMLTNLGQEDIIKKTHDLGAAGYLIKADYNPYQVIEEVKKYIAKP
ncbi:response regulator [Candidatus Microgenomates bacterium]|nr:response regulator [Candidatus Microgenomates bacterium]